MEIKIDINTPYQIAEFAYQKADEATKEKMRCFGKTLFFCKIGIFYNYQLMNF